MKIRCHANSIRLRVRKSDLEALNEGGAVREEVTFAPGQSLIFELRLAEVQALTASFRGNLATVSVPMQLGRQWIATDEVGLEAHQEAGTSTPLHLLIEKDFPCKHQPTEDKQDTFQELG
ncbi:MAG: hypothetical protein KDC66_05390 [Phaeodactylibacter sp.]|nr:hypothetical protein [Phaeodactylibacter sp.]MCB9276421.1 hypothetical protein [Lewinellaceae bacterium]